jgi:predicted dinucleotide-binding enzyme
VRKMKIATIGRGTIGGGLARLWELFDRVAEQHVRPSCFYAAEDDARQVTEQLIRDAGYEPVSVGGLGSARALEDFVPGLFARIGDPVFYRFAPPGEL